MKIHRLSPPEALASLHSGADGLASHDHGLIATWPAPAAKYSLLLG
jgi:hypothetical protein